jgi:hypothetical protein
MNSSKCVDCGLVNFQGETKCRRCGTSLSVTSQQEGTTVVRDTTRIEHETASYSTIPEYGLPPDAYAPPRLPYGGPFAEAGVWRDGNTLIMLKTARMPDSCIKCGVPANGSHLTRKLSWHHPALYLLIFAGLLIYAIVALIVRKSARIDVSLCEDHIRKHRTAVGVGWLVFLAGVAFIVFAVAQESGGSALFGIALVFASAIYSTFLKVVRVKRIDDNYVWLLGIDESVLTMLPSVNKG